MVDRLFTALNREVRGLHEAAYLLAAFSFLSQLLAVGRDHLLANAFGAGHLLDLYYAAFKIPDFITAFVASAVSISVLVPFLVERFGKSHEEEKRFIDSIFTVFVLAMIAVSAVAFIAASPLLHYMYPAIVGDAHLQLVLVTRILLFQPFILGISNFLGSITQAHNRFVAYAISPVAYNIGIVLGVVVFYPIFGFSGLMYGVIVGALLHLSLQLPFVWKKRLLPRVIRKVDWAETRKVFLLSLPRTFTLSISSLSVIALVSFASKITAGSISVFSLAWNLQSVTLSVVGVSYSLAAFPTLSKYFNEGNLERFAGSITSSLRHIIFWTIPITVLFIVLRAQVVRTIYGSGNFDWTDTRLTAASLALFTISALAQAVMLLLVRGYYAAGMTKKPLWINTIGAVLIVLFAYGFSGLYNHWPLFVAFTEALLRVQDIAGTSVLMLPLGYSVATIINAAILWVMFTRDFKGVTAIVSDVFWKTSAAAIIMGFVAYKFLDVFAHVFNQNKVTGVFLQGFCSGMIGIVVYVIILWLLKSPELAQIIPTLRSKISKGEVVVSEPEIL